MSAMERSGGRVAGDVRTSLFVGVDEAGDSCRGSFAQFAGQCLVDVPIGLLTRDDFIVLIGAS